MMIRFGREISKSEEGYATNYLLDTFELELKLDEIQKVFSGIIQKYRDNKIDKEQFNVILQVFIQFVEKQYPNELEPCILLLFENPGCYILSHIEIECIEIPEGIEFGTWYFGYSVREIILPPSYQNEGASIIAPNATLTISEGIESLILHSTHVKHINIPESLTKGIEYWHPCLHNYDYLTVNFESVYIHPNNPKYVYKDHCIYNAINHYLILALDNPLIQEGTIGIHDWAFPFQNLIELYIPKSVIDIKNPFLHCDIKRIIVDKENPKYTSGPNNTYIMEKDTNRLIFLVDNEPIPTFVRDIGFAFYLQNRTSIVRIPEGVTELHEYALYDSGIHEIVLPKSLKKIYPTSLYNDIYDTIADLKVYYRGSKEEFMQICISDRDPMDEDDEDKYPLDELLKEACFIFDYDDSAIMESLREKEQGK